MEASEFKLRLGPPFDQDRHSFYNYIIDCILGQALQIIPRAQVGTNIYESGLTYADDIVVLSNSYREMLDLREAVNYHATTVGTRTDASKTKVFYHLFLVNSAKPSYLMVGPWRNLKN